MKKLSKIRAVVLVVAGVVLIGTAAVLTLLNIYEDRMAGEYALQLMDETVLLEQEEIDENADLCGSIEIEDLDIRLPVFNYVTENNLMQAPCRYMGSAESGDLIIAAHNYKSHFALLKELKPGGIIRFTDAAGKRYEYKVKETVVIDGTAVEDMISGDWDLTLFTCTIGGKHRITVRCESL